MLLVNDSLKFTSSDTQICWNFLLKKCESAKATHIFSAKHFWKLYIESSKIVNEMALNELFKLMNDALNNWALIVWKLEVGIAS